MERIQNLTVCIPTYKRKALLLQTLGSIASQSVLSEQRIDIVISDDDYDSSDVNCLDELSHFNIPIRWVKNPKQGQFNNLNNLITVACGEWLLFLHDDDLLMPQFLEAVMELRDLESVDIIWTNRKILDTATGNVFSLPTSGVGNTRLDASHYVVNWLSNQDPTSNGRFSPPMVSGILIRKSLITKISGFPTSYSTMGDGLFLYKAFARARYVYYLSQPYVIYRWASNTERSRGSNGVQKAIEFHKHTLEAIKYVDDFCDGFGIEKKQMAMASFKRRCTALNGPIGWYFFNNVFTIKSYWHLYVAVYLAGEIQFSIYEKSKVICISIALALVPRRIYNRALMLWLSKKRKL